MKTFGGTQRISTVATIEPQTILLVDDSENDTFLLRRAFKKAEFDGSFHEIKNGEVAIAYLKGEGIYSDRKLYPLPALVTLDLNMPMKNGFDVLSWVRTQPALKWISIVVMTASKRSEDVERAFELGANSFLVKPIEIDDLANMLRCLHAWLRINQFPPRNNLVVNVRPG